MATLTKKDLLEAIEDMPMDAPIMSEINDEPMFLTDVYYDSVNKEIHNTMLIEKDYCDLESTKALESLGMNVYTSFCGVEVLKHLSLYEAQKWLREEKGIHVLPELGLIYRNKNGLITHYYRVLIKNMNSGIIITLDNDRDDFESYEEALAEGVKEAVKILKKK